MTTVPIEIASAVQASTRALMSTADPSFNSNHCLVLWISSASSTTTTTVSEAAKIANAVLADLRSSGADVFNVKQTVSEGYATDPSKWEEKDPPDFTGEKQGPFYVRFAFQLDEKQSLAMVFNNLPTKPALQTIETQAYTADFPV